MELLGLIIDNKLRFERHCKIMPNNVQQTPCTQIDKKILNIRQRQSLKFAFVDFRINYTPLIWMFCKKNIKNSDDKD